MTSHIIITPDQTRARIMVRLMLAQATLHRILSDDRAASAAAFNKALDWFRQTGVAQ